MAIYRREIDRLLKITTINQALLIFVYVAEQNHSCMSFNDEKSEQHQLLSRNIQLRVRKFNLKANITHHIVL